MRQEAYVIEGGETAKILVIRESACSGDCNTCGGCHELKPFYAAAANPIGALKGQRVSVETPTGKLLTLALTVYLLPLAVLFITYFILKGFTRGELVPAAGASAAAALSFVIARLVDRRQKHPLCQITGVIDAGETE